MENLLFQCYNAESKGYNKKKRGCIFSLTDWCICYEEKTNANYLQTMSATICDL